jgi:hypothetical protein
VSVLSEAMDQLADPEAQCALAHFLAGWFAASDPAAMEQALAEWEATR